MEEFTCSEATEEWFASRAKLRGHHFAGFPHPSDMNNDEKCAAQNTTRADIASYTKGA